MFKPTIKSPCSEDWDKMKIGVRSRYCEKCALDVMDFSSWSRFEIIHYLIEHRGERTCGRLRKQQTDISFAEFEAYITAERKKTSWKNHYWKVLSLASLMLLSCNDDSTIATDTVIGQIKLEAEIPDSLLPVVSADTAIDQHKTISQANKNECTKRPVKPDASPDSLEILQGDVIVLGLMEGPEVYAPEPFEPDSILSDKVYTLVDVMPSFGAGGDSALFNYINEHLTYPKDAKDQQIEGKVIVKFVVKKDGAVEDVEIVRGISGVHSIDSAVNKLMSNFPNWNPGELRGQTVNVQMYLPIRFELN